MDPKHGSFIFPNQGQQMASYHSVPENRHPASQFAISPLQRGLENPNMTEESWKNRCFLGIFVVLEGVLKQLTLEISRLLQISEA